MIWIIFVIIVVIVAWIIYSIIVSPKEKAIRYNELEFLKSQYNLSDYYVDNIKTNYIDQHKFLAFNAIKNELHNISNYYEKYGAETTLSSSEFQKECIHHICSGTYDVNNNLELFVKNNLMKRLQNRPLPNKQLDTFNVPENETIEDIILPPDITNLKLNLLAQITYTDAQGQISERRITIKSISESYDGDYIIQAYCHEKQAQRSFKLSRISKLVDMETGEMFSNPQQYFLDRFHDSPIGLITSCFQNLESEILVLTFVARSDGFLRKKEREIIIAFIIKKTGKVLDTELLDGEIRRTYCDTSDFRSALKLIGKKSSTDKQLILETATNIIATDKIPDPMELGTLDLIKKELRLE